MVMHACVRVMGMRVAGTAGRWEPVQQVAVR